MHTVPRSARDSLAEDTRPATLINRLTAVPDTYSLVSRWQLGAMRRCTLAARTGEEGLAATPRIVLDGPAVLLTAKAAVGIGMALHELAATPQTWRAFGPQGRLRLGWQFEEARLLGRAARHPLRFLGARPPERTQAGGYGGH